MARLSAVVRSHLLSPSSLSSFHFVILKSNKRRLKIKREPAEKHLPLAPELRGFGPATFPRGVGGVDNLPLQRLRHTASCMCKSLKPTCIRVGHLPARRVSVHGAQTANEPLHVRSSPAPYGALTFIKAYISDAAATSSSDSNKMTRFFLLSVKLAQLTRYIHV